MTHREKFDKDSGKDKDKKFRPDEDLQPELQREIEEALGEMSLEDLMEADAAQAAEAAADKGSAGEQVRRGQVVAVQGDDVFVDLGGKSQGILPASQFADQGLPECGQTVEFTIEGFDEREGLMVLSLQGAVKAATWDNLDEGQVVEGRVTGHNKGGLELTINGIDAFMPISQIEQFRVEELGDYINQKLKCLVTEVDPREGKVIVSRRELLYLEAKEKAKQVFDSLQEGQTVEGVVKTIMPYGAFVDIGGLDGLLHVSDMSYARVEDPQQVVQVGQKLKLIVLKVDREKRRISLGLKQALPDPWAQAESKWRPDDIVTGRIVRLADFGAFLELTPGVEGLIPISEMSYHRRLHHPSQIVSEGDAVKARVLSLDVANKRISLSIKRIEDDPWTGASVRWPVGSVAAGRVSRIAEFGAFVELAPGVEGLVHVSELGVGYVRSVAEVVGEGDAVEAKVLSVDEESRRISLSVKQAAAAPEHTQAAPAPAEEAQPEPSKSPQRRRPLKGGLE